jgi:DeoR/GlpR family transcriptional regulator of sugar metabolism
VSTMTIHRDLTELERQGVVRRVRGGVEALPASFFEMNLNYRKSAMRREKAALGRYAASLIKPGMSLLLDASTTTLALVPHLASRAPLTVVTNQLEIIKLASASGLRVISLGGEYLASEDCCIGVQCLENLRTLRVDLVFLSALSVSGGEVFDPDDNIVMIKRNMMACAERSILLVDHTKFRAPALLLFASLNEFDLVVTDEGVSPAHLSDLRSRGVQVELASVGDA